MISRRMPTLEEVAVAMGISAGAVHVHLRRAQEKVRVSWLAAYLETTRQRWRFALTVRER